MTDFGSQLECICYDFFVLEVSKRRRGGLYTLGFFLGLEIGGLERVTLREEGFGLADGE